MAEPSPLRPSVTTLANLRGDAAVERLRRDLPDELDPRLVLLREPRSPAADVFRMARHRLERLRDPHLILVTSVGPGEGKSTLAANLALAIAEERASSVLLLDAHRARPALPTLFGVDPAHDVVLAPPSRGYTLEEAGDTALAVALALGGPGSVTQAERTAFRRALTALRLVFDYVVIDAAPVELGIDVCWIAELVDGVVFALRRGVTERTRLRRALELLEPAPIAGAVLLGG